MPSEKLKWTRQQRAAIETVGRDVLVTASAGTGKTAVLSERCARILAETKEASASEMLVLTFTEAAAEEMRFRIAGNLRKRYAETRDGHVRHQLLLLDAAYISTIHAFCKRVITENFHAAGIDPNFRIIDEDERALLKSEVLDAIIEEAWGDAAVSAGLHTLLSERNIQSTGQGFLKRIIQASNFLDSVISADDFFERAKFLAEAVSVSTNELAEKQRRIISEKLTQCREQVVDSMVLDAKFIEGGYWAEQLVELLLEPVDVMIKLAKDGRFAACAMAIRGFSKPRLKNKPKEFDKETAELIKKPAKKAMDTIVGLNDLAVVCERYDEVVGGAANLQTKVLVELIKRFDRRYQEAKLEMNCLDFADLEHTMLRLLDENEGIAAGLGERFKFIFVDEYQDINAVQQAILDKIQRGDNTFVVGDIKQSIYAFRQARPGIFLDRLAGAVSETDTAGPLRVDLSDNFRSRKDVLDFANMVFARIMTEEVATVDYDESNYLRAGFEYLPVTETSADGKGEPVVEFYVLDEDTPKKEDAELDGDSESDGESGKIKGEISGTQRQAAFVTERIRQMVGACAGEAAFKIYDKETGLYRAVEYRDIVILMRSPSGRANEYAEMLELAGIPVSSQTTSGYFKATEISDCVCLLKVLDNFQRDIELAAVLRSPLFGVSDTELAVVANAETGETQRDLSFYNKVRLYCETGSDDEIRGRLCEVMGKLNGWRDDIRRKPIADVLWGILRQTGYLSFVGGLPNGKQRRANILKMHDRAIQFEGFAGASQGGSLSRFVEFIEKLLKHDKDWAPAEPETSAENAVRIMSVHKSKGLEFPVVFLAELSNRFNKKDCTDDCLFDDGDTLGLKIVEPGSKVKLASLAHQVIAEEKLKTTYAEEMRVLYVAMTRARERLILTGAMKAEKCGDIVSSAAVAGGNKLREYQLRGCNSHFDWILCGLANQTKVRKLFGVDHEGAVDGGELFSAEVIERDTLDAMAERILQRDDAVPSGNNGGGKNDGAEIDGMLSAMRGSLGWRYEFEDIVAVSAKTSVSRLSHRGDEFASTVNVDSLSKIPEVLSDMPIGGGDASRVGTATHLVIQKLDLSEGVTVAQIRGVIENLVDEDLIAASVVGKINVAAIEGFFASELGRLCVSDNNHVFREWPFTFAVDAAELGAKTAGENVIVQGIIDLVIRTPEGLIIIDFKTDNVSAAFTAERAKRYAGQMEQYCRAAGSILGEEICGAYLYFLTPGVAVSL